MKMLEKILEDRLYAKEASYTDRISLCFQPDSFADFQMHSEFGEVFSKFSCDDCFRGMDVGRLWSVILNIKHVLSRVDGAVAELGVYKGHMSAVLSHYADVFNRRMYMIDTFQGFSPDQLEENLDDRKATAFQDTNVEHAKKIVGAYSGNHWLIGAFPGIVTPDLAGDRFAFVSLDCDLYEPIKAGLEFFYPRLSAGGMIFVHDYSSGHWPGAKRAVDEFAEDNMLQGVLLPDKSGSYVIPKV
jgi:hypothetical protein